MLASPWETFKNSVFYRTSPGAASTPVAIFWRLKSLLSADKTEATSLLEILNSAHPAIKITIKVRMKTT